MLMLVSAIQCPPDPQRSSGVRLFRAAAIRGFLLAIVILLGSSN
jgi:hypothetical protein